MNYMPGTASLIQDIDSECAGRAPSIQRVPIDAAPRTPVPYGCRIPWGRPGGEPRGQRSGAGLLAATALMAHHWAPRAVGWGPGCSSPRVVPSDPRFSPPIAQRSTWSCCGTGGRSSGTCAASTSSVRAHLGVGGVWMCWDGQRGGG